MQIQVLRLVSQLGQQGNQFAHILVLVDSAPLQFQAGDGAKALEDGPQHVPALCSHDSIVKAQKIKVEAEITALQTTFDVSANAVPRVIA